MENDSDISIPLGFTLHSENNSHILLPPSNEAFLNPVQEFNRDTSVACIRVWSEELNKAKEARWRQPRKPNAKKPDKKRLKGSELEESMTAESASEAPQLTKNDYRPYKFVLLEALSATGLRSIRYAKEIPLVNYVIANDISSSAVAAMTKNAEINGLGPPLDDGESDGAFAVMSKEDKSPAGGKSRLGKIRINQGDACTLMYNHREERNRVDVVDLDPYGTAAPFIDSAVQCVNDGGLLCVTCTDLSVLATTNYPEKCFSNYGGIPVKAEYCHEAALRLVIHSISTSASRYGRYIQPLLSLSVDFYVRLFIKIQSAPIEVKKAAAKTCMYYVCVFCQSFYEQPLGKIIEKVHEPSGNVNCSFKTHVGPTASQHCPECNSVLHMAGPMWSGPIQDSDFIAKVLHHLEDHEGQYGTSTRMKGMLTVAKEELNTPFYFTPSKVASFFHCTCPPLDDVASALLHAGHGVSRSHACPGSLKTTGSRQDVHDVFRSWIKLHPVTMGNISEGSPARQLLNKEPQVNANFTRHSLSVTASSNVKLVRYQQNPTTHWGPGTKAHSGTTTKRKRGQIVEDE